jgi:hypothetical protein
LWRAGYGETGSGNSVLDLKEEDNVERCLGEIS